MRHALRLLLTLVAAIAAGPAFAQWISGGGAANPPPPAAPSVVIVMCDDCGTDQDTRYGATSALAVAMPNLDRMAAEGLRATEFRANPQCAPTRTTVLSGLENHITGQYVGPVLAYDYTYESHLGTLARAAGAEADAFGKFGPQGSGAGGSAFYGPQELGFDVYSGKLGGTDPGNYASWTLTQTTRAGFLASAPVTQIPNYDDEYVDDHVVAAAMFAYLNRDRTQPYLVKVDLYGVHTPHHMPPAGTCTSTNLACRQDMLRKVDELLGVILDTVDRRTTTVLFFGDNGSESSQGAQDVGGKSSVFEHGIRVPFYAIGPNVTPGTVETTPLNAADVWATALDLVGVTGYSGTNPAPADLHGSSFAVNVLGESSCGFVGFCWPDRSEHTFAVARSASEDVAFVSDHANAAGYKLVHDQSTSDQALYDLSTYAGFGREPESLDRCGGDGDCTGLTGADLTAYNHLCAIGEARGFANVCSPTVTFTNTKSAEINLGTTGGAIFILPQQTGIWTPSQNFSYAIWYKADPTSPIGGENRLIGSAERNDFTSGGFAFTMRQGANQWTAITGAQSNHPTTPGSETNVPAADPDPFNWHHYAVTYDGTIPEVRIYRDAILQSTTTLGTVPSSVTFAAGQFVSIGALDFISGWPSAADRYVGGWIDEPGMWGKTLTPAEVAIDYNGGEAFDRVNGVGAPSNLLWSARMGDSPSDDPTPGSGFVFDVSGNGRALQPGLVGPASSTIAFVNDVPQAAPSVTLSAAPNPSPSAGTAVVLDWTAVNVTSCTCSQDVADPVGPDLDCSSGLEGQDTLNPNSITTYTINCDTGTVIDQVTVPVGPAPTVDSFTATPGTTTTPGDPSTLDWSSSNATSCTGTNFSTAGATSGSVVVNPTVTTQYTVQCDGPGGQSSPAQVSVFVGGTPTPFEDASLNIFDSYDVLCQGNDPSIVFCDGFEDGVFQPQSVDGGAMCRGGAPDANARQICDYWYGPAEGCSGPCTIPWPDRLNITTPGNTRKDFAQCNEGTIDPARADFGAVGTPCSASLNYIDHPWNGDSTPNSGTHTLKVASAVAGSCSRMTHFRIRFYAKWIGAQSERCAAGWPNCGSTANGFAFENKGPNGMKGIEILDTAENRSLGPTWGTLFGQDSGGSGPPYSGVTPQNVHAFGSASTVQGDVQWSQASVLYDYRDYPNQYQFFEAEFRFASNGHMRLWAKACGVDGLTGCVKGVDSPQLIIDTGTVDFTLTGSISPAGACGMWLNGWGRGIVGEMQFDEIIVRDASQDLNAIGFAETILP